MAQIYFHCSSAKGVMLEQCADVDDLTEAREYGRAIVQSLIAMPGPEDWRNWALHISDELGQEILVMTFSSMLGRPH